jgi:S-phase kinase-associated protein 1
MCKTHDDNMEENDEDIIDFNLHCINVSGDILGKVVEYCDHYQIVEPMIQFKSPFQSDVLSEIVTQTWYAEFINVDRKIILGLISAANYLNIQPLLKLACLGLSASINGKSVEDMQKIFNITPPIPQEEVEDSLKNPIEDR